MASGTIKRLLAAVVAIGVLVPALAWAGPPFFTDDPVPVDTGHWEVYGFSNRIDAEDDTNGILAGVEVNYGVAPDTQLHVIVPLAFDAPPGGGLNVGAGDVELGVKYRLFNPERGPRSARNWPQIAIFPLIEVPTGKASADLGAGYVRAFLPLWLEKDFGDWTTYGGGGYWINPGPGNCNYWFAGWLLQKRLTKRLSLGGELFYQTHDETDGRDGGGFNVGVTYDFTEHYHLLLSAGRGLINPHANQFSYYIGLQHTF